MLVCIQIYKHNYKYKCYVQLVKRNAASATFSAGL